MKRTALILALLICTGHFSLFTFIFSLSPVAAQDFDWTAKIKNPSFESGTAKWTLQKSVSGWEDMKITSGDATDGDKHYNLWAQKVTSLNLYQELTLPAGHYKLSAQMKTNTQGLSDQHVYVRTGAGTINSSNLSKNDYTWETLTVSFTLEAEGTVTIGAASTGNGTNEKGWFCIDDFRLYGDREVEGDIAMTLEQVTQAMTLTGASELHITGTKPFTTTGSIDITGTEHSVLFFDNLRPSEAKKYLAYVKINGEKATAEKNCQLRLYDHGTVLYPYGKENKNATGFHPLTVYTEQYCQGEACETFGIENTKGFMNTLTDETLNNRIRSFRLKRGYMVTFAIGEAGWGYQRCFIADSEDLIVNTLPAILDQRISSYRVFRWDNVGKNGVANILDTNNLKKLNCTWTYAWGMGQSLGSDYECVPHMNNLWSTTDQQLGQNNQSPNLKTDNEPANSADPYPATVAQELERWPQLMRTGRRLLSPSSFDSGEWFHQQFFDSIDARGWRCDVVDIHCYWNEGNFNNIRSSWADKYHRPVWITEFIWGASWSGGFGIFDVATTNEERGNPSAATLEKNKEVCARIWENLNGQDCVERYAYWNDEWPCSKILWNGNLTPAGEYYAKMKTGTGYNPNYDYAPREWRCQAAKSLLATYDAEKAACVVEWQSMDCDLAESITLQRREGTGAWQDVKTWERPDFVDFNYEDTDVNGDKDYSYRVVEKTWKNKALTSGAVSMSRYLINGSINAESKTSIKGWTCERNAKNGNTKADGGDTYFEVWDTNAADIDFNYYQDVTGLPAGVYQLEAACFNSTDGVSGATVNGHMGLYAEADGVLYFSPVTRNGQINYSQMTIVERIIVRDGKMRVGIRNIGRMSARWAGADNFRLTYLGTEDEVLAGSADEVIRAAGEALIAVFPEKENGERDASGFIMNADCVRSTTTFWTVNNLGITSGQAWDGNSDNKYFDKWNSGSLNSSMQQTIVGLPAGQYRLSALMRGTPGINLTLRATHKDVDGKTKSYNKTIKGQDGNTIAGSDYQRGWLKVETDIIDIAQGDQLIVGASTSASQTAWWSVDHFQLTYIGSGVPNGISGQVVNSQSSNSQCYDLQGRRLTNIPQRGIYIINGKKYLR